LISDMVCFDYMGLCKRLKIRKGYESLS